MLRPHALISAAPAPWDFITDCVLTHITGFCTYNQLRQDIIVSLYSLRFKSMQNNNASRPGFTAL